MISCLNGSVLTHQTAWKRSRVRFPALARILCFLFCLMLLLLCFHFFIEKHKIWQFLLPCLFIYNCKMWLNGYQDTYILNWIRLKMVYRINTSHHINGSRVFTQTENIFWSTLVFKSEAREICHVCFRFVLYKTPFL